MDNCADGVAFNYLVNVEKHIKAGARLDWGSINRK